MIAPGTRLGGCEIVASVRGPQALRTPPEACSNGRKLHRDCLVRARRRRSLTRAIEHEVLPVRRDIEGVQEPAIAEVGELAARLRDEIDQRRPTVARRIAGKASRTALTPAAR